MPCQAPFNAVISYHLLYRASLLYVYIYKTIRGAAITKLTAFFLMDIHPTTTFIMTSSVLLYTSSLDSVRGPLSLDEKVLLNIYAFVVADKYLQKAKSCCNLRREGFILQKKFNLTMLTRAFPRFISSISDWPYLDCCLPQSV